MKSLMKQSIAVLALLAFASIANATVITVPTDQPTIRDGVAAAVDGDTVLVEEGVYYENVVVSGKDIVLASRYILDGDNDHVLHTIINGSTPTNADTGSCVILYGGVHPMVMGFTLTKGTGTKWFDVSDSHIYREGGGVLAENNTARIYHNLIVNNHCDNQTGATSAGGGGIRVGFGGAEIIGNVIAFNTGKYGAGVVLFFANGQFLNNIVYGNVGGGSFGGAGTWIVNSSSVTAENNTVVYNHSLANGGGMYFSASSSTFVNNNIVWGNTAVGVGPQFSNGASVSISYCDVEGGYPSGTNISNDPPMFDAQNFLLTVSSACIDSGNPSLLVNDIEDGGNPGFALFPSMGTVRNDKGAYGGQNATQWPRFTSPAASLGTASIDLGTIDEDDTTQAYIVLNKQYYGILTVDSIVFPGNPDSYLSSATSLPYSIDVAFTDSILIRWTPVTGDTIDDTALIYHNDTSVVSPFRVPIVGMANKLGCCIDTRGDANGNGVFNVVDLNYLVAYFFLGGAPPPCVEEADANGNGILNVVDLNYLVAYFFLGGSPPTACP